MHVYGTIGLGIWIGLLLLAIGASVWANSSVFGPSAWVRALGWRLSTRQLPATVVRSYWTQSEMEREGARLEGLGYHAFNEERPESPTDRFVDTRGTGWGGPVPVRRVRARPVPLMVVSYKRDPGGVRT